MLTLNFSKFEIIYCNLSNNSILFLQGMIKNMSLGKRLRNLRIKNKLTQSELAENIMTANTSIINWEKGLSRPNRNMIALISKVFNVNPFELIGDYNLNDIEALKKQKWTESYEDILALEFSKDIIKNISINESNETGIKCKNLNELFNELSEQINEMTSTLKDFSLGISLLMSSKLLFNGGESFLIGVSLFK